MTSTGPDFLSIGSGRQVIFLHGFCETKEIWLALAGRLAKDYQVFLVDLPGFGNNPELQHDLTLEAVAVWLQEWMDELNILNPIVIGHSLGGYVTMALTELMPSRLAAIGLFHSSAFGDDEEKKRTRDKTYDFVAKHGLSKFLNSFVPPLFAEPQREDYKSHIMQLIEMGEKGSPSAVLSYILAMRNRKDRFEVWQQFSGGKLFFAGEVDTAIPLTVSRKHQAAATH
jgi:pimeloyl-ACP methyl ester carboxylesterase